MRPESLIARGLSVVDRALRASFPEDYDKRCMYAAFGLRALLRDAGLPVRIVGGDFLAFVVAHTEQRAGLQGFGNGAGDMSHYWVETDGTLIDLGPHYLPRGSSYPAAKMPIVCWRTAEPLPVYLRYRPRAYYDPDVQLLSDPEITARMERFLGQCESRSKARAGPPKLPAWLLTGPAALETAARRGDVWARNAMRFVRETDPQTLPF